MCVLERGWKNQQEQVVWGLKLANLCNQVSLGPNWVSG